MRPAARRTNEVAAATPASPLRRLLDLWGFVPGIGVPHEAVRFAARDGTRLSAAYVPGPARRRAAGAIPAVVIAPGFAGFARKPLSRERL